MVLEGSGKALVGGEEFGLEPGVSFVAPAGVQHQIKSLTQGQPIKLFWFHAQG